MEMSARWVVKALAAPVVLVALATGPGCVDIVGSDLGQAKYVERDEKHFSVSGKPDLAFTTFDGSIEIRPWDKPEVQVVVEKRGRDKHDVDLIEVKATQDGNRVEVTVTEPKNRGGFNLEFNNHRSAKLFVSVPASADISARSGDGSIDIEKVNGKVQLSSGDGSINGRLLTGAVDAHTGDGAIKLADVRGDLRVDTGDGSISLGGQLTSVHARSGDGSVIIEAEQGSAAEGDWDIVTGDGSVTLAVPDGFGAELDAHTGDGRIRMEDITLSNVSGALGRNTVKGRLGGGGHNLRVRTGDGSITLRRF
jgi:DUF4097 and DUF4098 domain-containing protein YvlB